jgi:hypothetical protein
MPKREHRSGNPAFLSSAAPGRPLESRCALAASAFEFRLRLDDVSDDDDVIAIHALVIYLPCSLIHLRIAHKLLRARVEMLAVSESEPD